MRIAIILAFLMTLITASGNVVLKKGFSQVSPFIAVFFSVVISTILLWIATFVFVPRPFFSNYRGIIVFSVIGSFAPAIVRTLTYMGIQTLGAGRAAPLRAMTPFFAVVMAIFFLGESPTIGVFAGIILIVAGVVFLAKKGSGDTGDPVTWRRLHFVYPLGAAILAGIAANLRKYGMNVMPQPVFASAIAATSSLIILSFYFFVKYDRKQLAGICRTKGFRFIIIAAVLTSCGEIVDLAALLYGKVSLVIPIFAATPLIIVFFSRIFLKKEETITRNLILAAILIAAGIFCTVTGSW